MAESQTLTGTFITFEGPEGGGKTTQIRLLLERLTARQPTLKLLHVREPGGTPAGDRVRAVLLDRELSIDPAAELLLYSASRAQLVAQVIRPHLSAGGVVICDRYADSTMAYQGYGRGLPLHALQAITTFATGNLKPNLTIYLDIDPAQGIARREQSGEALNRMDAQTLDFHRRVREGYLALIAAEPERWIRIDADQPLAAVQGTIATILEDHLRDRGLIQP